MFPKCEPHSLPEHPLELICRLPWNQSRRNDTCALLLCDAGLGDTTGRAGSDLRSVCTRCDGSSHAPAAAGHMRQGTTAGIRKRSTVSGGWQRAPSQKRFRVPTLGCYRISGSTSLGCYRISGSTSLGCYRISGSTNFGCYRISGSTTFGQPHPCVRQAATDAHAHRSRIVVAARSSQKDARRFCRGESAARPPHSDGNRAAPQGDGS